MTDSVQHHILQRAGVLADTHRRTCPRQLYRLIPILVILLQYALAQETKFEQIGLEQGLLQNHVTALFQDSRGLIWIGTSDGLNQFDGYRFKAYRFDSLDPTSISGNYIYHIMEDRSGKFWIRTSAGGIDRFDPISNTFTHFRNQADNPGSLSHDDVSDILEDQAGNIWIATAGGGLNVFHEASGGFVHVRQNPQQFSSLSSDFLNCLYQDSRGDIWIGTNGSGLNRLSQPQANLADRLLAEAEITQNQGIPLTRFEHFFAQGPTYPRPLMDDIEALNDPQRNIASITRPGNYQDSTLNFTLDKATTMLVVAMGDGNAYGMLDYGWIESADSQQVFWAMDYEESRHAGGASRNRIQLATIRLTADSYRLRYRSDSHHSFDNWTTEQPHQAAFWGIKLIRLNPGELRQFSGRLAVNIRPNSLPHNRISTIAEDARGQMWIGTADGLALMQEREPGKPSFQVFRNIRGQQTSLGHNNIAAITSTPKDNCLWIQTADGGLNRLNISDFSISRFGSFGKRTSDSPARVISALLRANDGSMWIGTTDGLFNAPVNDDPGVDAVSYLNDASIPGSISANHITCLMQDRSGNLWIGTERGGLNKLNRKQQHFRYLGQGINNEGLSGKDVTAILEASNGIIWVGTSDAGLNRLEADGSKPKRYRYTHFRAATNSSTTISHDHISALYEDRSGGIWIGTYGGGLSMYDPYGKQFKHYQYQRYTSNSLTSNYINTISGDQYGQIWIGTRNGLTKLDKFRGRFTQYRHAPDNPNSLSDDEVWSIYEDFHANSWTLWIGTRSGGLNRFNRDTQEFTRFTRDFDDPTSLNNQAILSIYQDRAGDLWFGTYSGGLNKFNRETEEFSFLTERDGLVSNMILGILEDAQGNLWLSTNKGITKFDPNTIESQKRPAVRSYDVSDGLQANQFNAGAFELADDGEMFFGGINGMNSFYPDSISDNPYLPPVVITAFSIRDQPADHLLAQATYGGKPIELSHDQNFISFEFASLDYTNPGKNRYAFRMLNVDEDWVQAGTRRFHTYTDLDPGTYTFSVRGSNNDGLWSDATTSVDIIVLPPFYKTWWFSLGALLFVVALATITHKARVRYKLRRLMEIEQVRLMENERVRTKAARDFHDELGHKLTKISLFSEIVKRNLNGASPEVTDYLERINHTAKGLAGGMRDFIWTLNPEKDSLHEVAMRLKDFGDGLFDKTGIAFRTQGVDEALEAISLTMDTRRHITLIFKEAMNNALKHSGGENVVLTFNIDNDHFSVSLSDDGKGILAPQEHDDEISRNGTHEERPRQPSGNGLHNMQLRARKISGSLDIEAQKAGGTKVCFSAEIVK